jgi:hypothetical protein
MDKTRKITPEAPQGPSPAQDLLPQAQAALSAQAEALRRLLEEKRSLSWTQFATD